MRTILNAYFQASKNADELGVIPHAIPIYWFGEPTALVATVAINPGPAEFAGDSQKSGYWGNRADFGTHRGDYTTTELDEIETHCTAYFSKLPRLDKFWKRLEGLLHAGGASYLRADAVRACHVDLVPWATKPVWGGLEPWQRMALLAHADEARRRMFAELRARVLVCRGASATTEAGRVLGFFDGAPPWQRCSAKGDVLIMRHPDGSRWLLGTRQWDFDANVKQVVGAALRAVLEGGEAAGAAGAPGGMVPSPPASAPSAASAASAGALLAVMRDVAAELEEMEGAPVTLDVGETQKTYTVWMNGSRGKKVATVAKGGGKVEFPASNRVVAAAAGLTPRLQVSRTWKESQVCLTGITLSSLPLVEADLRTVMAAAIHDHPAFGA